MISLDLMKSSEVRIAGDQPNCEQKGSDRFVCYIEVWIYIQEGGVVMSHAEFQKVDYNIVRVESHIPIGMMDD